MRVIVMMMRGHLSRSFIELFQEAHGYMRKEREVKELKRVANLLVTPWRR